MKKERVTDEQVEQEIERLKKDSHVKLAMVERNIKIRRRRYMYDLRYMEKRGKELETQGFTLENIYQRMDAMELE